MSENLKNKLQQIILKKTPYSINFRNTQKAIMIVMEHYFRCNEYNREIFDVRLIHWENVDQFYVNSRILPEFLIPSHTIDEKKLKVNLTYNYNYANELLLDLGRNIYSKNESKQFYFPHNWTNKRGSVNIDCINNFRAAMYDFDNGVITFVESNLHPNHTLYLTRLLKQANLNGLNLYLEIREMTKLEFESKIICEIEALTYIENYRSTVSYIELFSTGLYPGCFACVDANGNVLFAIMEYSKCIQL